jgi:diguanylate cyclase (GGDEF)-like protein
MPTGNILRDQSGVHPRITDDALDVIVRTVEDEQEESGDRPTMRAFVASTPMRAMLDTPLARVELEPDSGTLGTLTVLRGCDVGKTFTLDSDRIVIGRAPECEIWLDDSCASREHARIVRRSSARYVIEDLGSTNGTFVGERRIERGESVQLLNGARVQIGPTSLLRFGIADPRDEMMQSDLFRAATRDALSGMYNRRYFEERLGIEVARARRAHLPLSLLMLDVDGLKSVNDGHGHLAGDAMLRAVANRLSGQVRLADVLARWGGDEFVLIAPAADRNEAASLAERLRAGIASLAIGAPGAELRVTLSVGIACLDEIADGGTPAELVARADARLYRAKRSGKNCVLAAG